MKLEVNIVRLVACKPDLFFFLSREEELQHIVCIDGAETRHLIQKTLSGRCWKFPVICRSGLGC